MAVHTKLLEHSSSTDFLYYTSVIFHYFSFRNIIGFLDFAARVTYICHSAPFFLLLCLDNNLYLKQDPSRYDWSSSRVWIGKTKCSTDFNSWKLILCRTVKFCGSQWPRGLRRRSAAARLLRLRVRIPSGAWIFICCLCCVLSGGGLCVGPITCPEESYRLWCVVVWDLETSWMRRP